MNCPMITVFTPTYNRKDLLHRCYESLKRQTSKNFYWLIVDDGSKDDTEGLVNQWQQRTDNGFEIEYYYKENGGLHTAYNCAIEHMKNTVLSVCIDSDDYMPDNAIELIEKHWNKYGSDKYGGIAGLDYDFNNQPICNPYPDVKDLNVNAYIAKHKMYGDRKYVIRTDLYKKVAPMPVLNGEKNFNPHYMHLKIFDDYNILILNENLCYVEYQADGMTNNIFNQYVNSPNSFAQLRRLNMTLKHNSLSQIIRNAIHYDASCIIAKRYSDIIKTSPKRFLTTVMFPFGFLLKLYILHKSTC